MRNPQPFRTVFLTCLVAALCACDKKDAPPTAAATAGQATPKADAPKADAPKADAPKADAPKADAPKADAPKADAPKADAPKADAPKAALGKAPPTGTTAAILADLPESTTVFATGVEGLDGLVRMADAVIAALPAQAKAKAPPEVTDPAARTATLGADLGTAAGWAAFGVDPTVGAALTLDASLPDQPLIFLRVTDRAALLAKLGKLGAKITAKGTADGVEDLDVDGKPAWVGKRGATTVIALVEGEPKPEARAKFKALLSGGAGLAGDKTTQRVFGDLGSGARYWAFAKADRAIGFAAQKAGEPLPHTDFITKRVLGLGLSAGPGTGGLRLLTDPKAADALKRILAPSAPTANFARYFGPKSNLVLRTTINFANMFDGAADLVPPDLAGVRGKIMVAKNSVPVLIGVQLADLAAAFTGHIAVAFDPSLLQGSQPPFVALLDVADAAAADKVVQTLLKRLNDVQKMPNSPVEVAGHKGFKVGMGAAEVVVVRHEKAVLIGREAMIAGAISNPVAAQGALAAAIDADTFYGFVVDPKALIAQLPPDPDLDPKMMEPVLAAVLGEELAEGHVVGGFSIDGDGILADSGRSSAMLIGVLAAVAIPAFVKYIRRSKASEARVLLRKMSDSIAVKAMEPGFKLQAAPRTPSERSCDKYAPDAAAWAHPAWRAIEFSMSDPHYFQYELLVDGDTFTARAYGDLDCDGDDAVFEIGGRIENGELNADRLRVRGDVE